MTRAGSGSLPRYILQRTLLVIPMIWVILTLVFIVLRVAPGDPVSAALGGKLNQDALDQRREALGFNRPLIEQYWDYLVLGGPPRLRHHLQRQPAGAPRDPRQRRGHPEPDAGGVRHRARSSASRSACSPAATATRCPTSSSGSSASSATPRRSSSSGFLLQVYVAQPLGLPDVRHGQPDHRLHRPSRRPTSCSSTSSSAATATAIERRAEAPAAARRHARAAHLRRVHPAGAGQHPADHAERLRRGRRGPRHLPRQGDPAARVPQRAGAGRSR